LSNIRIQAIIRLLLPGSCIAFAKWMPADVHVFDCRHLSQLAVNAVT
jgi:hypothetical protein